MHEGDNITFSSLGLADELCKVCESIGWKVPTDVQRGSIPQALKGHDIIGVSQTGSGKTGAYILPILNALYLKPRKFFALILTPTRELAEQVANQIHTLGSAADITSAIIIGGDDSVTQALCLAKKPNVIIATPGRLLNHLVTTKGFRLDILEYLVFDEADRILNTGFEEEVKKLQMVSLKDPVKVEISGKYETPKTLRQRMLLVPLIHKDCYLYYVTMIATHDKDTSTIIFCNTWNKVRLFTYMLRNLEISAVALYGQMTQEERTKALDKFKSKKCQVMVATDLVSRGLDIPFVDRVIIYDVPRSPKDYVHRVGRTARAGRSGTSYILCTEFELFEYIEIEELLGYKIEQFNPIKEKVLAFKYEVTDAIRAAKMVKEIEKKERKHQQDELEDEFDNDDTEEATGIRKRLSKKRKLD